ncbi:MAG: 4-hydroxy-3-methylbut-2-enyl diphosphate reductase [Candidatus Krumholzibacteriia bacterium]
MQPDRQLLIASPRGFCAGVERAIDVVERLLEQRGAPIYVRKEIVHNQAVVADFRRRGVVFVEELDEVPDGAMVVFSAHGISPAVRREAELRGLATVDATCPLVTKVHRGVQRHARAGRRIILIGHEGHDEVLGTTGEAPDAITLVTSCEDVASLDLPDDEEIAYVTQTTLSVDETAQIVAALRKRFPRLVEPRRSDICYATQNRQDAVKELLRQGVTHLLVVGSANSSNSQRLGEAARRLGATATLVDGPDDVDLALLGGHRLVGLTAGASAPEHLVQAVVTKLSAAGYAPREVTVLEEDVRFSLPPELHSD